MKQVYDVIEITEDITITLEVRTSKSGNFYDCCVLNFISTNKSIILSMGSDNFFKIKKYMEV